MVCLLPKMQTVESGAQLSLGFLCPQPYLKNSSPTELCFLPFGGRCLSIKKIGCNSSLGIICKKEFWGFPGSYQVAFEAKNSSHITPGVSHRTQDVQRHGRGGLWQHPANGGRVGKESKVLKDNKGPCKVVAFLIQYQGGTCETYFLAFLGLNFWLPNDWSVRF